MTIVLELIISLGGAAKQLSETLELTENVLSASAEPTETHRHSHAPSAGNRRIRRHANQ